MSAGVCGAGPSKVPEVLCPPLRLFCAPNPLNHRARERTSPGDGTEACAMCGMRWLRRLCQLDVVRFGGFHTHGKCDGDAAHRALVIGAYRLHPDGVVFQWLQAFDPATRLAAQYDLCLLFDVRVAHGDVHLVRACTMHRVPTHVYGAWQGAALCTHALRRSEAVDALGRASLIKAGGHYHLPVALCHKGDVGGKGLYHIGKPIEILLLQEERGPAPAVMGLEDGVLQGINGRLELRHAGYWCGEERIALHMVPYRARLEEHL